MAFTCYASLERTDLGQVGPPAQLGIRVSYSVVNTTNNTAMILANGDYINSAMVSLTAPVANQQAVLTAMQNTIQAQEPGAPSMSFIWVRL